MNELNNVDKDNNSNNINEQVDNQSNDTTENDTKGSKIFDEFCDMMESVLFSIFTVILIFTFVFKVASVIGTSMQPTLEQDDKLIVSSTFYNNPQQKDIVIVNAKDAHLLEDTDNDGEVDDVVVGKGINKTIVKRIIAVEGQTVDIDFENGNVYIDGEVINEPYIYDLTHENNGAFEYPITVPEGYVFVLGDHRSVSKDSRSSDIGLVPIDDIVGKVVFRISPLEKFGLLD